MSKFFEIEKKISIFMPTWKNLNGDFLIMATKIRFRGKNRLFSEVFTVPRNREKVTLELQGLSYHKTFWMKRFFRRFLISRFLAGRLAIVIFVKGTKQIRQKIVKMKISFFRCTIRGKFLTRYDARAASQIVSRKFF